MGPAFDVRDHRQTTSSLFTRVLVFILLVFQPPLGGLAPDFLWPQWLQSSFINFQSSTASQGNTGFCIRCQTSVRRRIRSVRAVKNPSVSLHNVRYHPVFCVPSSSSQGLQTLKVEKRVSHYGLRSVGHTNPNSINKAPTAVSILRNGLCSMFLHIGAPGVYPTTCLAVFGTWTIPFDTPKRAWNTSYPNAKGARCQLSDRFYPVREKRQTPRCSYAALADIRAL